MSKMSELDMDRQRVERLTDVVRPPTFAESARAGAHRDPDVAQLREHVDELKRAIAPFAALADVCDHFKREDAVAICSWRIGGEYRRGPTAGECRKANAALTFAGGA